MKARNEAITLPSKLALISEISTSWATSSMSWVGTFRATLIRIWSWKPSARTCEASLAPSTSPASRAMPI